MKRWIKIHNSDDVAVALEPLMAHEVIEVDDKPITLTTQIPKGHKFALRPIEPGERILKYGYTIGIAKEPIAPGNHIHVHNTKTSLHGHLTYTYTPNLTQEHRVSDIPTFKGYSRSDGSVGIRNELWIIPTVGCVNGTANSILTNFRSTYPQLQVDIKVWSHPYGCSQLGDDHNDTRQILIDMIKHPNAGGVLVLGLGCENNHISQLKELLGKYDEQRVLFLEAQRVGNEIQAGLEAVHKLAKLIQEDQRVDVPISELCIGLKCGGSDGLSGITANPLVGAYSDYLISRGGASMLTEVPEMFGAEQVLMNRAADKSIFNKVVTLIDDFKSYYEKHQQPIYENPSPGNKDGGITTLEDKSLGCIQKGGMGTVVDVLQYGERIQKKGLNLLQAPGNDLVAATALAAAGCHMVLFTTGRGTPFGTFVPTLKISSNSELSEHKPHWIDFNAGTLVENEEATMEQLVEDLSDLIIRVANGEQARNESNGYHEIAIFKTGVTL
jgi:altronate hydrolase